MIQIKKYFLVFLFLLCSCLDFQPENKIKKQIYTADNKFIIYAFIRSVNSTTSNSPQVSILNFSKEKFDNKNIGNIFIGSHSDFINVYWSKKPKTLIIEHNCKSKNIFKKEKSFKNIKIEYKYINKLK